MAQWLPLESNPETMTKFMRSMGVPEPLNCVDVLGFDDETLALVSTPVVALIFCFPEFTKFKEAQKAVYGKLEKEGKNAPPDMFFMKQSISNACGTFALFHGMANAGDSVNLGDGLFKKFLVDSKSMDPDKRCAALAQNTDLAAAHADCAAGGQSAVNEEKVEHHFICFVNHKGVLYEIDSSAPFPRARGSTSSETLLKDAAKVAMEFAAAIPDNIGFSAIALVNAKP